MNKCHSPIGWHNDTTPAINETNLNYMDGCIDTIDDRVVAMDTTKANQSDLLNTIVDWEVNEATGDVSLIYASGRVETKETNLAKIAMNMRVIHDPDDPHFQQMEITYPDGTLDYIDFSAFISNIELIDGSEIHFVKNQNGTVSASIITGSITADKLQPNFLADCQESKNLAVAAKDSALQSAASATASEERCEEIKDYIDDKTAAIQFELDSNGNLVYTDTLTYDFTVNQNGELLWEVNT